VCGAFHPNPTGKLTVDHRNEIKTDNHTSNLRWATHSEQNFWSKGDSLPEHRVKGISQRKNGKWLVHYNKKHIGIYDTFEDAKLVRDALNKV
jgi:hypothetical protein